MLLPYQQRWVEDVLDNDIQFLTCEKSRRIGITWCTCAPSVLMAALRNNAQDIWYIGYKESLALEFVNDCAAWAENFQQALSVMQGRLRLVEDTEAEVIPMPTVRDDDGNVIEPKRGVQAVNHRLESVDGVGPGDGAVLTGDKNEILTFRIKFPSGKRISALTSAPSNMRGLQGVAIIDEAAFHDRLPELLKAAIAFTMWGGKVIVVSTHNGVDNDFNKLCEAVKAGRRPGTHHRIPLMDAVEEGLFKRICLVRGKEWSQEAEDEWVANLYDTYREGASEELDCEPANDNAHYISAKIVESCMRQPADEQIPEILRLRKNDDFALQPPEEREKDVAEWCERELTYFLDRLPTDKAHFFGLDFGRSSDLTVMVPCNVQQSLVRYVPFIVELSNVPHQQQLQVLTFICDRLPRFSGLWADATGNGSFVAEAAADRYGSAIVNQVKITDKWYGEHVPALRAALQARELSIPADLDVRNDITAFELVNGVPKLPKGRKRVKGATRHGDAGVALTMCHAASRADDGYWDYLSRQSADDIVRRMTA